MKIFKTYSEKEVKRVMPIVNKINSLEPEMKKLTDHELKGKTEYFKKQLAEGKTLDDILQNEEKQKEQEAQIAENINNIENKI